jgi:uncharacterized protein (TIGR02594 family)
MGQYIDVMRGDEPKKFWEKDAEFLTQNFPDAYREALLEKTVDPDSPLWKVKKVILQRVADGAASIDRSDFKTDKDYQNALLKNFENITGIKIDEKSAEWFIKDFINNPKDKKSQEIIQALAPIVAEWSSEDSRGWWNHMEGWAFQDSNPNLTQNTWESFSDSPEFNRIKSLYNGISEANNPGQIQEFHKAAGLNAWAKTPWCMSFVQYVLRKHYGYQWPQTAAARDGLRIGEASEHPGPGDLVLIPRNGGSGYHIAFVERVDGSTLTYWGWNQSNMVCSKKMSVNSPGLHFRDITNSWKTNTRGH